MADFAATAGKTDDMTHANAKIVPPARHENRMAARAYALVMRWLVRLAALITVAILVFLIGYILVNGIPNLKPSLFEWTYNSDNVSLMPALINTILMTAFSLAIAPHRWAFLLRSGWWNTPSAAASWSRWCASPPKRCRASPPSYTVCSVCCSLSCSSNGATA